MSTTRIAANLTDLSREFSTIRTNLRQTYGEHRLIARVHNLEAVQLEAAYLIAAQGLAMLERRANADAERFRRADR